MLDHATFHPETVLLSRLRDAASKRQVVVLAGSALTMPVGDIPGVPTTAGIVDMIREILADDEDARHAFKQALDSAANPYQKAFETLNAYRGTSVVNRVIRQAVLAARRPGAPWPSDAVFDDMHQDFRAACQDLEADTDGWAMSPGVEALGRLIARHPRFGRTILTTNFDPLIEVAITRAKGDWYRLDMGSDGSLGQAHGRGSRVVHVHGHWYGALTLHTPAQLLQPRPQLEGSLRRLLDRGSVLLVLAYSGWDDVLTRALAAVLRDAEATPEVLWTFYWGDESRIRQESSKLLGDLVLGSGASRVTLFRGIDVHRFLPRLADALSPPPLTDALSPTPHLIDALPPSLNLVTTPPARPSSPAGSISDSTRQETAQEVLQRPPALGVAGILAATSFDTKMPPRLHPVAQAAVKILNEVCRLSEHAQYIESIHVSMATHANTYQYGVYGWPSSIAIKVRFSDRVEIPGIDPMQMSGHTHHYNLGAGRLPGLYTPKRGGARLCGAKERFGDDWFLALSAMADVMPNLHGSALRASSLYADGEGWPHFSKTMQTNTGRVPDYSPLEWRRLQPEQRDLILERWTARAAAELLWEAEPSFLQLTADMDTYRTYARKICEYIVGFIRNEQGIRSLIIEGYKGAEKDPSILTTSMLSVHDACFSFWNNIGFAAGPTVTFWM